MKHPIFYDESGNYPSTPSYPPLTYSPLTYPPPDYLPLPTRSLPLHTDMYQAMMNAPCIEDREETCLSFPQQTRTCSSSKPSQSELNTTQVSKESAAIMQVGLRKSDAVLIQVLRHGTCYF